MGSCDAQPKGSFHKSKGDKMKRTFEFKEQETYTQQEVNNILVQHSKFVENSFKNHITPEGIQEAVNKAVQDKEIASAKQAKATEERDQKIVSLAKLAKVPDWSRKAVVGMSNISPDATDEQITTSLEKTLNSFPNLSVDTAPGVTTQIVPPKPVKKETERKYMPDGD